MRPQSAELWRKADDDRPLGSGCDVRHWIAKFHGEILAVAARNVRFLRPSEKGSPSSGSRPVSCLHFARLAIAVGTPVVRCHRVAGEVTRPRLPQNVACRFPALRSSEVGSQRCSESLQHSIGEMQLRLQQREPVLDLLKFRPVDRAFPAPAAQHLAPVIVRVKHGL